MSKPVHVRFSLASLLALTALLAVFLARVAENERRVRAFQSLSLARFPLAPRNTKDFVGRALLAILGDDELGSRRCACSSDVLFVEMSGELSAATTAPLADLPELREVYFQNAHVTDDAISNLRRLPRLKRLYLGSLGGRSKQSAVTDQGLRYLSGLTDLEVLDLRATGITDAGLKHLMSLGALRELYLCQTAVTDAGVEPLKKLSSLEILMLDGTAVTDQAVGRIAALPHLELIGLEETRVTDEAFSYLILAPSLREIRFDSRAVSRETYTQMRELRPDIELDIPPQANIQGTGMF